MTALDSLGSEPRWVAWRYELRGKDSKPTKVPYAPINGAKAKTDNPSTWGSRIQAEAKAANIIRTGRGHRY
jgi:primase-polymerase (primpol)-like protein